MSLREFGRPRQLSRSGGWLIERPIEGTDRTDAIGTYPLFSCNDWTSLARDLDEMQDELVSVVAVTDPFGRYDSDLLKRAFQDLVIPFKQHYVADLSMPLASFVHPDHLRKARKALESLKVERVEDPISAIPRWVELYEVLKNRHSIRGISAFSPISFAEQSKVPGTVLFQATAESHLVGMVWWYFAGHTAYYHLGAYSEIGYATKASFLLFRKSLEHLQSTGIRWASLGGGAGLTDKADGLTRFKRGWTNTARTSYLCGRVLDREAYQALAVKFEGRTTYFPAYRQGEGR
jgi:hypothetical protein